MTNEFENKEFEGSSLPIGSLAEETKGRRPRTRTVDTRESQMRSKQQLIDRYRNENVRAFHGNTYIDYDVLPKDKAYMWARTNCKGRDLSRNFASLCANHGWEPVPADYYPQMAYMGKYGDIDDSASFVSLPDLRLVMRDKEINDAQLASHERNSRRNRGMHDKLTIKEDGAFATANNEFFPIDPASQSFSNTFNM